MSQDRPYVEQNNAERERLRTLVSRLSDEQLDRPLGHGGWTVAVALAHLAFWDQYALGTLTDCECGELRPPSTVSDAINDAAVPLWLAIPPRAAAQLAVDAAEAVDRRVSDASPQVVEALKATGRERTLNRHLHRREHLEEIERALAG